MQQITPLESSNSNGTWNPIVGEETTGLLISKGFSNGDNSLNDSGNRVLDETYRIMQACGNPSSNQNNDTGLVIGYVQSGKTLSFTTLTALARDNNFQIVIVIAGTSINLVDQSTERLKKDLRLDDRYDRKWSLLKNPSRIEDRETIETTLAQWSDPTFSTERCKTVLITVMKNGSHLNNLVELLSGLPLQGVPTLIIDDEGDQASLNTRARQAARQGIDIEDLTENDVSTIYRRIVSLRSIFSHHTFLQYTATPQANLFINILDRLSPNFIKLLTPGSEYTGAREFFIENRNLVAEIPLSDIPTTAQPLVEAPESLLTALRVFYLGVSSGEIFRDQRNRTMLVHPSRLQGDHNIYFNWVNAIRDSWRRLLNSNDQEEKDLLLEQFRVAYNDLQLTVDNLPSFEDLTGPNLIHAIQYTPIIEVNSRRGSTPKINWQDAYSRILVGGQSMDRGFTVEGLTVSYMPRNLGIGNVDTVLQRARFLGYKRGYLGFCRVYLPQVSIDAFDAIIEHEEDVRQRLEEFDVNNKHLNNWDREAVLDQMLGLTRSNVLYDVIDRDRFGNDWFSIDAPHDTESYILRNRDELFQFLNPRRDRLAVSEGHPNRTPDQHHLVARIPLRECLEHLLNKLKFTRDSDSATYSSLRGIIKRYLEDYPNEECLLFLMSARSLDDWTIRSRRLDRKGHDEINELFQGKNPKRGPVIYPGDREIKDENLITVQVHRLNITNNNGEDIFDDDGNLKFQDVVTLAIWVPEHIGRDIIRQS